MLFTTILAFAVATVLLPALIRHADALGLVDHPDPRKVHVKTMPRVGGIAMVGGMLAAVLTWDWAGLPLSPEIWPIVQGSLVLLVFGVIDDRFDLHFKFKFLGQVIAALLVVVGGDVEIQRLLFIEPGDMSRTASVAFTVFALVGVINAVNLSDGLDGLAGGTVLLSLASMALLTAVTGGTSSVVVHLAVIGSVLAFLRYNSHPARVFMGDAGSQVLGLVVGASSIILTQKTDASLSTVVPLWIIGFPIIDTIAVMVQRKLAGVSLFKPDRRHIHHRLLSLGFGHRQVVLIIYLLQSLLILAGYVGRFASDFVMLGAYLGACAALSTGLRWMDHTKEKLPPGFPALLLCDLRLKVGVLLEKRLRIVAVARVALPAVLGVYVYMLAEFWLRQPVSSGLGVGAVVALAVLLLLRLTGREKALRGMEYAVIYGIAGILVLSPLSDAGTTAAWVSRESVTLALLGVLVFAWFLYRWKQGDAISTVGFLTVILASMLVVFAPDTVFSTNDQRMVLIKLMLVWYAIQFAIAELRTSGRALGTLSVLGLAGLAVRALI